jgi:hypothetical protein
MKNFGFKFNFQGDNQPLNCKLSKADNKNFFAKKEEKKKMIAPNYEKEYMVNTKGMFMTHI